LDLIYFKSFLKNISVENKTKAFIDGKFGFFLDAENANAKVLIAAMNQPLQVSTFDWYFNNQDSLIKEKFDPHLGHGTKRSSRFWV